MNARMLAACLLACIAGCTDEALVGEGSACAARCSSRERCVQGACVPLSSGAAGDDSDTSDEDEHGHDGEDHDGPGDGRSDDVPGDEFPGRP